MPLTLYTFRGSDQSRRSQCSTGICHTEIQPGNQALRFVQCDNFSQCPFGDINACMSVDAELDHLRKKLEG